MTELPSVTVMRSPDDTSPHAAGRSAHREYERRRAARRQRAKARYGPLGALFTDVTADPATIQAWRQGAGGESRPRDSSRDSCVAAT
jgi:hypothetical protein